MTTRPFEVWALRGGDWMLTRESRLRCSALPLYDEPDARTAAKGQ